MNTAEITLPEVQSLPQSARFYKDGEKTLVEISFIGSKDNIVRKVQPEHMAKFRDEWNAFCDGEPLTRRKGTPLTEVMDEQRAQHYFSLNVHNVEELSALSDGQCQALGHGTLTLRETSRKLMIQRKIEAHDRASKVISDATSKIGAMPEAKADIDALKSDVAELKTMFAQFLAAQAENPKRGRPPKVAS